jgi:hypothetical protein
MPNYGGGCSWLPADKALVGKRIGLLFGGGYLATFFQDLDWWRLCISNFESFFLILYTFIHGLLKPIWPL